MKGRVMARNTVVDEIVQYDMDKLKGSPLAVMSDLQARMKDGARVAAIAVTYHVQRWEGQDGIVPVKPPPRSRRAR